MVRLAGHDNTSGQGFGQVGGLERGQEERSERSGHELSGRCVERALARVDSLVAKVTVGKIGRRASAVERRRWYGLAVGRHV